jgi:hypothetical protein
VSGYGLKGRFYQPRPKAWDHTTDVTALQGPFKHRSPRSHTMPQSLAKVYLHATFSQAFGLG